MKRGGGGNPLGENAVLKIWNNTMKRGGAGNPLGENAVFEDMKQEDEKGRSRQSSR